MKVRALTPARYRLICGYRIRAWRQNKTYEAISKMPNRTASEIIEPEKSVGICLVDYLYLHSQCHSPVYRDYRFDYTAVVVAERKEG